MVRVTLRKFSLRIEPESLEVKGERTNHCATEAPFIGLSPTFGHLLLESPSFNISI